MRLLACIKKDIRLLSGGGAKSLLILLLPMLLLFVMLRFMNGFTTIDAFAKPFPIAVRDEDRSPMSALLAVQLRKVSLFSEVIEVKEDVNDAELFGKDCAAVITIPKDYFYDLYDMSQTGIGMVLNGDMPKEAAAVRSAVAAVTGILEENQRLYLAAARIRNGEPDEAELRRIYEDYASASISDLMNRLQFFSVDSLYADEALSQIVFFAAGLCSMFLLFFPLCILRSLYEEKEMGICSRLMVSGGDFALILSKWILSLVLTAVPSCLVTGLLKVPHAAALLPAFAVVFSASFFLFFVLSLLCRSQERTQLIGNVCILMMLLAGGALFPYRLLPESIRPFSMLALPFYVTRGIYAAVLGKSPWEILHVLLPVLASLPVLAALSIWLYRMKTTGYDGRRQAEGRKEGGQP